MHRVQSTRLPQSPSVPAQDPTRPDGTWPFPSRPASAGDAPSSSRKAPSTGTGALPKKRASRTSTGIVGLFGDLTTGEGAKSGASAAHRTDEKAQPLAQTSPPRPTLKRAQTEQPRSTPAEGKERMKVLHLVSGWADAGPTQRREHTGTARGGSDGEDGEDTGPGLVSLLGDDAVLQPKPPPPLFARTYGLTPGDNSMLQRLDDQRNVRLGIEQAEQSAQAKAQAEAAQAKAELAKRRAEAAAKEAAEAEHKAAEERASQRAAAAAAALRMRALAATAARLNASTAHCSASPAGKGFNGRLSWPPCA